MKKTLFTFAFIASLLSSCNNAEELLKDNPEYIPDGTAVVNITLKSSAAPATYAQDEAYGTKKAFKEENEIKSIAFFAKVGTSTELKHYFSTEDDGSVSGLIAGLEEKDKENGIYEARFKLKGVEADQISVDFYAIANYKENDIDLSTIINEDDLSNLSLASTKESSDNPLKPLVMSAVVTKKIDNGAPTDVEFKLKRLVARIDVVNLAKDADFTLTSVRVINGKTQSYLLPDMTEDKVNAIGVANFATAKFPQTDATRIDSLYTYENLNGANFPATKVEVIGTYKNTSFREEVAFLKRNPLGADTIVSILRNNLYTINIKPNADSTEVQFEVTATDWLGADTFNVQETQNKPIIAYDAANDAALAAANATWDKATKSIEISDATAGFDFKFTASGNQDSKIVIKYWGSASTKGTATGATWMDGSDRITSGEMQGYASNLLSREYTLHVPFLEGKSTPSDAFVLIQNASKADVSDTIFIKFRPGYDGTVHKPVLIAGLFWAPINVGATAAPGTTVTTTWSLATCGHIFQWSRNKPFAYGITTDYLAGPVAYNTIHNELGVSAGANADKYITTSASPYDWLLAGDPDFATRNALWTPDVNISPCPVGWRVPTEFELEKLTDQKYFPKENNIYANGMLVIPSNNEPGTSLYLPAAGYRTNGGASSTVSTSGNYWSSSFVSGSGIARRLTFNSASASVYTGSTSAGYSLRCVQE